jgi:rRNA-processing protein FCF1
MEFKMFRRKNRIYITYSFMSDEIKLFVPVTDIEELEELEYKYTVTMKDEEMAKKMMKMKKIYEKIPMAELIMRKQIKELIGKITMQSERLGN